MAERMPVLYIDNASPLNGVADNAYTKALAEVARTIPRPWAILVTSADYETDGAVCATSSKRPTIIHDYDDFPDEVMDLDYPAAGSPALAERVCELIGAKPDRRYGLGSSCWLPLLHMYPEADVPVCSLSYDATASYVDDLRRGDRLAALRDEGVLIVVTGNIVRNPRYVNWGAGAQPFDWAVDFDSAVVEAIKSWDLWPLVFYQKLPGARLAAPSDDYLRQVFVALGAAGHGASVDVFHKGFELSSLSNTCIRFD